MKDYIKGCSMKKLFVGISVLAVLAISLNAVSVSYMCTTDKFEVKDNSGKVIRSGINSTKTKMVMKKEWYGKPSGISMYRVVNGEDKLEIVIPNVQSKIEWLQNDKLIFESNNAKLSMDKSSAPYVDFSLYKKNGRLLLNCIEN